MARSIDEPRAYYVRGKWIVLAKDSRRRGWDTPFKASRLQLPSLSNLQICNFKKYIESSLNR
jgi:hypothetical protein